MPMGDNPRKRRHEIDNEPNKRIKPFDNAPNNRSQLLAQRPLTWIRKHSRQPDKNLAQRKSTLKPTGSALLQVQNTWGQDRTSSVYRNSASTQAKSVSIEEESSLGMSNISSSRPGYSMWQEGNAKHQSQNLPTEEKLAVLTAENASVQVMLSTLQAQIAQLQEENQLLRDQNLSVQSKHSSSLEDKAIFQAQVLSLETENAKLRVENVALEAEKSSLQADKLKKPSSSPVPAKDRPAQCRVHNKHVDKVSKDHLEGSLNNAKEKETMLQTNWTQNQDFMAKILTTPMNTTAPPVPSAPAPTPMNGSVFQQPDSKGWYMGAKQEISPPDPGTQNEHLKEEQIFHGFMIEDDQGLLVPCSETGRWEDFFDWNAAISEPSMCDIQAPGSSSNLGLDKNWMG